MSEVLALAVEALVPQRHKAVNGCLVKFPGCVVNQFRAYCSTSSSEVNHFPIRAFLVDQKWRNRREGYGLYGGWPPTWISARVLAFSHVTCTRDPLAAGSELPHSCRNHPLLHMQRYCPGFAHSRLRLVSSLTAPAHFFFYCPLYILTFKVVPVGFYTFCPAFWQLFIPFSQKFFGWVCAHFWTYEITCVILIPHSLQFTFKSPK